MTHALTLLLGFAAGWVVRGVRNIRAFANFRP
jgi:hypothetical protein